MTYEIEIDPDVAKAFRTQAQRKNTTVSRRTSDLLRKQWEGTARQVPLENT
jgi:hypothetical protein